MSNFTAWFLLFVSLVGLLETIYLIHKRRLFDHPVCPMGGRCDLVLSSKYNKTLGIHNDVSGLFFYGFFVILSILFLIDLPLLLIYQSFILSLSWVVLLLATIMSLGFIYLQWRVIKAWCFWCVMSAFTVFAIDLLFLLGV